MLVASSTRSLMPGETSSPIVLWHGSGGRFWNNSTQMHANTVAEFFIDDTNADYYGVNIAGGYDTGLRISPSSRECSPVQCSFDMSECPGDLVEYDGGPCLSACKKYLTAASCCTWPHNTPQSCPASSEALYFKGLCPQAFTYTFDDHASFHTCRGAPSYTVTLCSSPGR
jgi:hypothetical protein